MKKSVNPPIAVPEPEYGVRMVHDGERYKPMLGRRIAGQPTVRCLHGDTIEGLVLFDVDVRTYDHSEFATYRGAPYPIPRFLEMMRVIADLFPLSPELREFLSPLIPLPTENIVEPLITPTTPVTRSVNPNLIKRLSEELKTDPVEIRKRLRAAGLRAPYDDEKQIRSVLSKR